MHFNIGLMCRWQWWTKHIKFLNVKSIGRYIFKPRIFSFASLLHIYHHLCISIALCNFAVVDCEECGSASIEVKFSSCETQIERTVYAQTKVQTAGNSARRKHVILIYFGLHYNIHLSHRWFHPKVCHLHHNFHCYSLEFLCCRVNYFKTWKLLCRLLSLMLVMSLL